jgi:3-phenylpropionate/cinnamic acid dioxygenase small subunit
MSILKREAPTSQYFNDAVYESLCSENSRDRGMPDAREAAASVDRLLHFEARLLDESRFEQWLDLFTDDCVYWVPASWPPADPRVSVSNTLDDRRRIEDRVARYETGWAFSQWPLSRTLHVLGQSECWKLGGDDRLLARTAFQLSELRRGELNAYAGYYEHILRGPEDGRKIEQKRVHLLQSDQLLKNISFIF